MDFLERLVTPHPATTPAPPCSAEFTKARPRAEPAWRVEDATTGRSGPSREGCCTLVGASPPVAAGRRTSTRTGEFASSHLTPPPKLTLEPPPTTGSPRLTASPRRRTPFKPPNHCPARPTSILRCRPALNLLSFARLPFVTPVMLAKVIEAVEFGQLRSSPAVRLIGCLLQRFRLPRWLSSGLAMHLPDGRSVGQERAR